MKKIKRIEKGQHLENPFKTLEELEAVKGTLDSQFYEAAKADLTRDDRVTSLVQDFPWAEDGDLCEEGTAVVDVVPCPVVVNKPLMGPVPQPGFVFADKIILSAEQIADYVIENLNASHLNNENIFSVPLVLDNEFFKHRFDNRWTLDTRVRVFDLLEAACAMVCQLGERGRKLDNKVDEIIPPMGLGKAYGVVSIFLDDDDPQNISLRITVQKGIR